MEKVALEMIEQEVLSFELELDQYLLKKRQELGTEKYLKDRFIIESVFYETKLKSIRNIISKTLNVQTKSE